MNRFTSLFLTMGCSLALTHFANATDSSSQDSKTPSYSAADANAHLSKLTTSQDTVLDDLEALIDHLQAKDDKDPKSITKDHMDAIEHLQEIATLRAGIIAKAKKEDRALTPDEIQQIQDPALGLALDMLPEDSSETKSLIEKLRSSMNLANAHISLHADMISSPTEAEGASITPNHEDVTLTNSDISSLKEDTKHVDEALAAYIKTLDEATRNSSDSKKALETLQALQNLRGQALDKLSRTPTLKSSDIQNLHSAEETNSAINALKDGNDDQKKAKSALSSALISFKENLDKATHTSAKTSKSHSTSPHDDEKKDNHDDIIDHHNAIADHIESLRNLLDKKENATEDHDHALEFLEESHDDRSQLLQKAQDEKRHLTKDEAAELQKDNNGLHVALGLLPDDTEEEQTLKNDIIDAHSALVGGASHHEDLHTSHESSPSESSSDD